ncbi:MAG: hypothetical protein IJ740_01205 [Ruminococcus sp.]|nr:hypothetical protein [Ruminococcus sp.]
MKLTYRDKILLIGAVVVIIWAIGIFLIIKPAFDTMSETSHKKDTKENEVVQLQTRVDDEANLKEDLQKAYDQAVEHSNEYFYKLDAKEEVTDNIRALLKTNKREIVNTDYSIEDLSLATVSAYSYDVEELLSLLEEQAKAVKDAKVADPNAESGEGDAATQAQSTASKTLALANTVSTYEVTSDFECTLDELYDFADTLLTTDQQSFIIKSCTIEDVSENDVTGEISFNYYMAPEIPKPAALGGDKKDDAKDEAKDDK